MITVERRPRAHPLANDRKHAKKIEVQIWILYLMLDRMDQMSALRIVPRSTQSNPAAPFVLDVSRFDSGNRRRLSGPGMRTFLAIADLWGLNEEERRLVLGMPSRSTYYGWTKAAREHQDLNLTADTLIRISAILGIHKALNILFQTEREGLEWLRGPHAAMPFGGQAPIALVTGGTQDGLMAVRRFLDAARGGLFMAPNAADQDTPPLTDEDIVFA